MPGRPPRILTRERLLTCILINQLATPGLGSLLARRKLAGAGQLLLALGGAGLLVLWVGLLSYRLTMAELGGTAVRPAPDWMWQWGLGLFIASWFWALATSFGLWLQARQSDSANHFAAPPKISKTKDDAAT